MNKIKTLFLLLIIAISSANAQIITLNYNDFSSNDCDVFASPIPVQGILHETKVGDITKNASIGAIQLKYDYNNGGSNQKGSEFAITYYTFKKDYKYRVKITARSNNSYSEPAGIKCNFNPAGIDPSCNGVNFLNTNNGTFSIGNNWFQTVNGTSFTEYTFESDYLSNNQTSLGIGTFSLNNIGANSQWNQTIYIKKIEIIELPPPPSFSLSPSTLSLECGDTSQQTFTVTPANIPSGATVTYSWNHSGWTVVSSTATSKTLQPNSGTTLPSNVSVTPYINGVAQPTKTCTVSRAPFSPSLTILGSNTLCSTGNYSVNTSTGITVTEWSVSDPSIAAITTNGNQATLSPSGNGQVTLTATLENACGQSANITKNVFVGYPLATGNTLIWTGTRGVNPVSTTPDATYRFQVDQVPGAFSYTWVLPQGFSVLWGGSTTTTSTSIYITTSATPGTYNMYCKANNDCGSSWTNSLTINNGTGGGGNDCPPGVSPPCKPGGPNPLRLHPNPASETLTIEPSNNGAKGEKAQVARTIVYSYTLYDFNGTIVQQGTFTDKTTLDVSKLKKGRYILKTKTDDSEDESHHIVIN